MCPVRDLPRYTVDYPHFYICRLIDVNDWQTTDDLFLSLNDRLRPHSVDFFTNYFNHKLPRL